MSIQEVNDSISNLQTRINTLESMIDNGQGDLAITSELMNKTVERDGLISLLRGMDK